MGIKNKIKKLLAGIVLAGSLLIPANAQEYKEVRVRNNEELKTALEYPTSEQQRQRIFLEDGVYTHIDTSYHNSNRIVLENRELIGVNNPIPSEKLSRDLLVASPLEKAIFTGGIQLQDNSKLSNVVMIPPAGRTSFIAIYSDKMDVKNVEVSNCSVKYPCFYVYVSARKVDNIKVDNCIFTNPFYHNLPIFSGLTTGTVNVSNSIFADSMTGIYLQDSARISLKDNVFIRNQNNFNIYNPPETLDWTLNWWYDRNGTLLTTRDGILNTGLVRNPSSASMVPVDIGRGLKIPNYEPVEVMPCWTQDPFNMNAGIKDKIWLMYE